MATITTFSGMRCTQIPRTEYFTFTTTSTSAASETAGVPEILSSVGESSLTSTTSAVSQPADSTSTSSITALAATALNTYHTITTATILPATTSSNIDPLSTQVSGDGANEPTRENSKKDIIAAAVGASMGAVAVVGLVILCAYIRRRKRRSIVATSPHIGGSEKPRNGFAIYGQSSGFAPRIGRLGRKVKATLISPLITTTRAVVTRIRDRGSTAEDNYVHDEGTSPAQPETMGNGMSITRQMSFHSQPESSDNAADPFADPPSNNATRNKSNIRSENPFTGNTEPFSTWADNNNDIPDSLPLTVRNADLDIEDNHNNNNHTNRESRLSGSTLNLSNGRASSPIMPDFNARLAHWRMNRKPEDRTSAYSDPFDLERPPTIHSSAHPTPMVDKKSVEGYFA